MSLSRCAAVFVLLGAAAPLFAQKEYGFDNRKPSGQPYLKPEESVARMKVADGFEVKLFAAEPMSSTRSPSPSTKRAASGSSSASSTRSARRRARCRATAS